MNRTTAPYALLLAALLGLSQCKKKDPDPAAQLPPATQTGANTFSCLVNGQAWTPKGNDGTSNYTVSYDTFPDGGLLQIAAYRIYGQRTNDFQSLSLWTKQFSCLVNGQAWTPKGNDGTSNYTVSYDTFPDGGLLQIAAYRIYGQRTNDFQSLSLWTKQISNAATFSFQNTHTSIARFNDQNSNCFGAVVTVALIVGAN